MSIKDRRPGNPLANQLTDIAFGAVFGQGHYSYRFNSPEKAVCQYCGKTVKAVGLGQHIKDVHKGLSHDAT
jgi:hypothetical protein